jgi:hypothetical protein
MLAFEGMQNGLTAIPPVASEGVEDMKEEEAVP